METLASDDGSHVQLGAGARASMQLFQQIYRDITGKSEKLSKVYSTSFMVVFGDFENLNQRLEHLLEQYNVVEKSCTVQISYTDDSHQRFSSFDRSRIHDQGSMCVVESVTLEYNFLIVLPVAQKPQPYKIVINLSSREGLKEKAKRSSIFEGQLLALLFASRTGAMAIEYVDYAVARNLQGEIDKWFASLHATKSNVFFCWLKKHSHHTSWMFKYVTASIASILFLRTAGSTSANILWGGIAAFCSIFVLSGIAGEMGSITERCIDGHQGLSYIKLTRGDEKLVSEHRQSSLMMTAKLVVGFAVAVAANVAAAAIAHYVGMPS